MELYKTREIIKMLEEVREIIVSEGETHFQELKPRIKAKIYRMVQDEMYQIFQKNVFWEREGAYDFIESAELTDRCKISFLFISPGPAYPVEDRLIRFFVDRYSEENTIKAIDQVIDNLKSMYPPIDINSVTFGNLPNPLEEEYTAFKIAVKKLIDEEFEESDSKSFYYTAKLIKSIESGFDSIIAFDEEGEDVEDEATLFMDNYVFYHSLVEFKDGSRLPLPLLRNDWHSNLQKKAIDVAIQHIAWVRRISEIVNEKILEYEQERGFMW